MKKFIEKFFIIIINKNKFIYLIKKKNNFNKNK